jgi:hypothetical protein
MWDELKCVANICSFILQFFLITKRFGRVGPDSGGASKEKEGDGDGEGGGARNTTEKNERALRIKRIKYRSLCVEGEAKNPIKYEFHNAIIRA